LKVSINQGTFFSSTTMGRARGEKAAAEEGNMVVGIVHLESTGNLR
jgi:hypothetical protein